MVYLSIFFAKLICRNVSIGFLVLWIENLWIMWISLRITHKLRVFLVDFIFFPLKNLSNLSTDYSFMSNNHKNNNNYIGKFEPFMQKARKIDAPKASIFKLQISYSPLKDCFNPGFLAILPTSAQTSLNSRK
jgi:hypothetical protein